MKIKLTLSIIALILIGPAIATQWDINTHGRRSPANARTQITPATDKTPKENASISPGKGKSKYYVITGLFAVKQNALNLSKKLRTEGYKPQLVKKKPLEQFYVTVGKFDTPEDAHAFVENNPDPEYTFWVKEMIE